MKYYEILYICFSRKMNKDDSNNLKKTYTIFKKTSKDIVENKESGFSLMRNKTFQPKSNNFDLLLNLTENIHFLKNNVSSCKTVNLNEDKEDLVIIKDFDSLKVSNKIFKKLSELNKKKIDEFEKSTEISDINVFMSQLDSKKDKILEAIFEQYYLDIVDNHLENYDNYVVSNLVIVSYIEKILPSSIKPNKLSNEEIDILRTFDRTKKTLFVDLDETLIHSDIAGVYKDYDYMVEMKHEGQVLQFGLFVRPLLNEFLEFASKNFNLILFTASQKCYADPILKIIDPHDKYFKIKLFRHNCIEFKNLFIKDLNILPTFGIKDMILIDNCIFSFSRNLKNSILISSYYNNEKDTELGNLIDFFENSDLIDCKDVREKLEFSFKFDTTKNFLFDKLSSEGLFDT